jgi:hypothetical protein
MIILGEYFDDPWKYVGVALIITGLFFLKIPLKNPRPFKWPSVFK